MNHFEFFGIPISFYPDQTALSKQFKINIIQHHPDLNEGSDDAEDFTAKNNAAFKILKTDKKRIAYILSLTKTMVEGEKSALPNTFLMEMMELNEALMDAKMEGESITETLKEVTERNKQIWQEIKSIGSHADKHPESFNDALLSIKTLFLQGRYLERVLEQG